MTMLIPLVLVLLQPPSPGAAPGPQGLDCRVGDPSADLPEAAQQQSLFGESYCATLNRLTPLRVGGNVPPPIKVRDVRPAYPAEAQDARVQGVVIIEAIVGADGKVANARILRTVPMLSESSLDAVSKWEYRPVLLNGNAVPFMTTVTVNYAMQ